MAKNLNFSKRVSTVSGHDIKIYEIIYPKYCNGAWYEKETDIWWGTQWNMDGTNAYNDKDLNLHNVK